MMGNAVGHSVRNQSDARTCAHSEGPASAGQNTVAGYIYFARSAFGVRCVSASLSCRHTDFGFRGRCSFFLWHERALRRNRMMALQPNQKIKDPHPPADWKTVTNISAKHCVHGWRKPQHIARRQKDYDEFLRVPGVHKTKINIHRAVYRPLVAGEQPFHVPRTLKHFVQNICASFAAEHCEKDAAAKDGIDEPGGIARKQPAVTV